MVQCYYQLYFIVGRWVRREFDNVWVDDDVGRGQDILELFG